MNAQKRNSAHAGLLVNQALLKLVRDSSEAGKAGEASYALPFAQFGDLSLSLDYAHRRFSDKLGYLCQTDQLLRTGLGRKAIYKLGRMAFKSKRSAALTASLPGAEALPSEPDDACQVSKALPNQYDVMRAPMWQVSHATVLRAGALDYQRYASHGDRC